MEDAARHKAQPLHTRQDARKHIHGLWPLQCDQRPVRLRRQLHACRQVRSDLREIDLLARGIDDERQSGAFGIARNHQVVDDAAPGVQELGVADVPRLQAKEVAGHERLQRFRGRLEIRSRQPRLPHMRNVEQTGGGAHMSVLLDDARRVLNRHLVASEGHKSRAEFAMQRVQRRGA